MVDGPRDRLLPVCAGWDRVAIHEKSAIGNDRLEMLDEAVSPIGVCSAIGNEEPLTPRLDHVDASLATALLRIPAPLPVRPQVLRWARRLVGVARARRIAGRTL